MSDNLAFGRIPEGAVQPELAANDVFAKIDAYFTDAVAFDATTNGALTVEQVQSAQLVRIINCNVAGRVLTLPATRRLYLLDMTATSNTQPLTVVKGATSITIPAGVKSDAYSDADANGLTLLGSAGTGGGGGPGDGGSGKSISVVQYTLDDDVYGDTNFANPMTAGNMLVAFVNNYITASFSSAWTVLKVGNPADQDTLQIAYRIVQDSEEGTFSGLNWTNTRPEGSVALFELSGATAADIDSVDAIVEAALPTVTTTVKPTTDRTLIIGCVVPSGSSAYYPQVMVGASVLSTFAQQGERDNITSGRSPAAFKGEATGTDDHTLSATFSNDNLRKLNLGYVAFKAGAAAAYPLPDPATGAGKVLGVANGQYAFVDDQTGGGGGDGTVGPVTNARYWRFLFQQAVGSNSNSAMGKIKIFAGGANPVPATVIQYSTRLNDSAGPDKCFLYSTGPDDGWATANGDRTPFVDVDLGSAVQPTKFAFTSLGSSYYNLTMTFVEIFASQDGIAYFPVQSIIMPTLDDAAGVTVERGASNVGSSGGGGGGGGTGMVPPPVNILGIYPTGTQTQFTVKGRGVSSITRTPNFTGGCYRLNFSTPFDHTNYVMIGGCNFNPDGSSNISQHLSFNRAAPNGGRSLAYCDVYTSYNGGNNYDCKDLWAIIYDPTVHF